ncbi:MAG TPA: ribosome maturation factor RimP [Polyangiaceae bacterium]|nr:ribosome maturation factor RimP [Polyangiaceae bacterium]
MNVSYEKIPGIDREKLHAAVGPVLAAHGVECVECIWRTDRSGWVLEISIERSERDQSNQPAGSGQAGYGVTIDLCADISRDLSAALDVADCIPHRYTLEVGSPGVERALYVRRDYERFAGQAARLKLSAPHAGQAVIFGTLRGLDERGAVLVETEQGELAALDFETIQSARILFEWKKGTGARASARRSEQRTSDKPKKAQSPQRSR